MDDILFFDYNQKSSILLLFFFNAMVFTFLLIKNGLREKSQSSLWLALFIFLGALYISPFMLGYGGWYSKKAYREFLFFMPLQQLFLIGPVLYFYIRSLLDKSFVFRAKDVIHFIPAFLYLLYSLLIYVVDVWILDDFYFYSNGRDKDLDFWYQMSGLISMLFYLYLGLKQHSKYRRLTLQEVSFADDIAYRWAAHFMMAFGVILVLRVLFFVLNPEWGEFGSKYWYYLCFSWLCFYMGISGYANALRTKTSFDLSLSGELGGLDGTINMELDGTVKWKEQIHTLFEHENIYKNPDLTLSDVAISLQTNRNIVSSVINREFGMNFNDFVNKQRARAVIEKLEQGKHTNTTLLGIALECGFNSKSTFNRAFKKLTGSTPNQYIRSKNL